MKSANLAGLVLLAALTACQKQAAPPAAQAEAPKVQNAFTDYVDRGVTTMNKAEKVAAAENARIQQTQQQTQGTVSE